MCPKVPTKRCVLALALEEADTIAKRESTRWLFMEIARAQAEAGDVDGALATVDRIGDIANYPQVFDAILDGQVKSGDITAILAGAARIEDGWQRTSAFLEIAEACADAGRAGLARTALGAAISEAKTAEPLATRAASAAQIAELAAEIGAIDTAHQAIDLALATTRLAVTPAVRSRTLADVAAARAVMGEVTKAVATAGAIADGKARDSALARVAAAQARSGVFEGALTTAAAIEHHAARASAFAWIAHAQDAAALSSKARDAIARAFAAATEIEDPEKRVRSLIQVAQLRPAPVGWREMRLASIDAVRSHRWGADLYLSSVSRDSETPVAPIDSSVTRAALAAAVQAALGIEDLAKRRTALSQVAEIQIATGNLVAALSTVEGIGDTSSVNLRWSQSTAEVTGSGTPTGFVSSTGVKDRILTEIAKAQGAAGDADGMLLTVGKIANPLIRVGAMARLANYFVRNHDHAIARTLVEAALTSAEQVERDVRRSTALTEVAEMQAALGDSAAALATAQKIEDDGSGRNALARIARVLAASQPQTAVQGIEDANLRTLALIAMAERRVAMGDKSAAGEVIDAALSSSETIGDSRERTAALAGIGEIQVAVGDVEGLRQTMAAVGALRDEAGVSTDQTYKSAAIAEAQANAGDFAAALATVEAVGDAVLRARTLVRIANALPN